MDKNSKVLSCVYAHFEAHGPGIYHNELIAKNAGKLDILYSNVMETSWVFPDNVTLITDRKKIIPWSSIYNMNVIMRWYYFLKYALKMYRLIKKNGYDVIVIFNPTTLLAFSIFYPLINSQIKIWYHNYDPIDATNLKPFSMGYFSYKVMFKIFPRLTLFSHSEEKRDSFFPIHLLNSPRFILPNYPMLDMHFGAKRKLESEEVRIIFSGVISPGNGLEDLIKISNKKIGVYRIKLILKGFVSQEYKEILEQLIEETGTKKYVEFIGVGPWKEVPEILRQAHIGVHIFHKDDVISKTMGKGGSGKVFQYIAEGLPVLMSPGFKGNFIEYNWAVPTTLEASDLLANINYIVTNYDQLSQSSVDSFKDELNCDRYFNEAIILTS
jgi:hypothetical protein